MRIKFSIKFFAGFIKAAVFFLCIFIISASYASAATPGDSTSVGPKNSSDNVLVQASAKTPGAENYIIKFNDYSVGQIKIINQKLSTYVSIHDILKVIRATETETPYYNVKKITMPTGREITYDYSIQKITTKDKAYKLEDRQFQRLETESYIEVNTLYTIFGIQLEVFNESTEVKLKGTPETVALDNFIEGEADIGPPVPPEKIQLQTAATGDDQQSLEDLQNNYTDTETTNKTPPIAKEDKQPTTKNFKPISDYSDDNMLVYEVRIGELSYDTLIDVYDYKVGDKSAYYVSLAQLCESVNFPITTDAVAKTAKGWFINESNTFNMNLNTKTLKIGETNYTLTDQDFFIKKGEIFILSDNIKKWFPIDYEIKYNSQILVLTPRVLLPFQEEELRRIARDAAGRAHKENNYPILEPPYKNYQMPEADVTITVEASNDTYSKGSAKSGFTTDAILTGDFGEFNTKTFLTQNDEGLSSLRIRAEKKDAGSNLYKSGISELSIGDIYSYPINLVNGADTGPGASISTYPINRPEQFDKTLIEGFAKPGWEAELYRNGQLITSQIVGDDGRYIFENVDVLYGENTFKTVLYGPQGEVRQEEKKVYIDDTVIKKGDSNFRTSVNQKNNTLVGIDKINQPALNRAVVQGEYGLTNNLTISSAFVADELNPVLTNRKENDYYQQVDLSTKLFNSYQNFNVAYNYAQGGYALKHTVVTKIHDTNINFNQEYYSNFTNYANSLDPNPASYTAILATNRNLIVPYFNNANIGFDAGYNIYKDGTKRYILGNTFSTVYKGYGISNNINSFFADTNIKNTIDTFSIRTNTAGGYLNIDTRYSISPDPGLQSVGLSYLKILSKKTNVRVDLTQELAGESKSTLGLSYNYLTKYALLGVYGTVSDSANYTVGLTISFSAYRDPVGDFHTVSASPATAGSATAFAYLDDNYNNKYDPGEKIIENSKFIKGGQPMAQLNNQYSYIRNLPEYTPEEIKLDTSSIEDPMWYPSIEGYNVITRSGVTATLEFPVVKTYEVDGNVFLQDEKGATDSAPEAVSGLNIYLLDEKGNRAGETKSEFDGYYVFDKVRPGKYIITVSNDQLTQLSLKQNQNVEINVDRTQDYFSNNNIKVSRVTAKDNADETTSNTDTSNTDMLENIDPNAPTLLDSDDTDNIDENFIGPMLQK